MAKKANHATIHTVDYDLLVVDNSILSATAKCWTYAYVRYALGLNVRGEALALEAGSAVHLGMEAWMQGASVDRATKTMAQYYEEVVERYLEAIEMPDLPEKEKRFAADRVIAIFHQHLLALEERFPFKVINGAVEKPISAELRPGVLYVARLDAIVRKYDATGKWSFDHKTTRRITDWWQDKQKVSSQWSGQVWLGKQAGVPDLEGVIVHAIELPEPHKSANKCKEHGVPYTECSIRHAGYDYVYVTRSPAEMEAWEQSAVKLAGEFGYLKAVAEQQGIEGVTGIAMQGRFNEGCVFCSMKEWCRLGRNTNPRVVKATFREEPWEPRRLKSEES